MTHVWATSDKRSKPSLTLRKQPVVKDEIVRCETTRTGRDPGGRKLTCNISRQGVLGY